MDIFKTIESNKAAEFSMIFSAHGGLFLQIYTDKLSRTFLRIIPDSWIFRDNLETFGYYFQKPKNSKDISNTLKNFILVKF